VNIGNVRDDIMPRFFFFLLPALVLVCSGHAQPLRVVTWKLDEFPLPPTTNNAPAIEVDPKRLKQIAATLKPLEADVIILQGIPDKNLPRRLTGFLKPGVYHVVNHSHYRCNGPNTPVVGPPITILAKKQPVSTRSVEWKITGPIDAPGGFVFAAFPHGTNTVCVYAAELPFAQTNRNGEVQEQLHLRHRELAAQYLLHHANWLASTLTNQLAAVLLAGDFMPEPTMMVADNTVRVLEQATFRSDLSAMAAPRRATLVDPSRIATPTLEPLFARNADFAGAPVAGVTTQFSTAPLTWDLIVKPPEPKPVAKPAPVEIPTVALPSGPMPKPAEDTSKFIWLAVGLVLATLVCVVFFQWLAWRRWTKSLLPVRRASNAVPVDFAAESDGEKKLTAPHRPAGMLAGPEGEPADPEIGEWQQRALQAEQRAHRAAALARSGIRPHLLGLMREKLVFWLTSQRSHLLDSHETGTAQVMELEERLERIQSQFQERLVAKDQRIAELEKELLAKDQLIQVLLKPRDSAASPAQASNQ
jgi:hypothetical protein